MSRSIFPMQVHVLDKADGSKYPYRLLNDFAYHYRGDRWTPAQTIVAPAEFDTDFASIPTRILKRILEPARFHATRRYVTGLKFPVWIYRQIGERIVLVGYRDDPVADDSQAWWTHLRLGEAFGLGSQPRVQPDPQR